MHKIFIVALLLSLTLSVCAVSAADGVTFEKSTNETDNNEISISTEIDNENEENSLLSASDENEMISTDESSVELSQSDEQELSNQKENDEIISDEETGTFSELQTQISENYGSTLKLAKNYEYDKNYPVNNGLGIKITETITIDGQGKTLDGKKLSRIFFIEAKNVILKNITFINGKSIDPNTMHGGGAIYFDGVSGTVKDCTFTNNEAESPWYPGDPPTIPSATDGGAMYGGSAINCKFTANTVKGYGGAMSGGSAINCTFIRNIAQNSYYGYKGGAMYECSAINCKFIDNTAKEGGAMSGGSADTCIFVTSTDTLSGTSILKPSLNIYGLTNVYTGEKLTFDLKTNSGMSINNGNISITISNKTGGETKKYSCLSGEGWIVELPVGSYSASFNTQYKDFAKIDKTLTVNPDTSFSALDYIINNNNNSVINLPHDFYFDKDYDVDYVNGIVINRPVIINGNGVTIDARKMARIFYVTSSDEVILKNLTFKNGNAENSSHGGAIYWKAPGRIENCNFINNNASLNGGAICWDGANGTVKNSKFTNNSADRYGGAIFWNGANGTLSNSIFTENTAYNGGAVDWRGVKGILTDSKFFNNKANRSGGAVRWSANNGTLSSCVFSNNNATTDSGGAVDWFANYGNLTNCEFIANNANVSGGAIFWNGINGTLSNSNFTGNKARVVGAIRVLKNFTIIGSTFKNNTGNCRNILKNSEANLILRDCNLETIVKISQINNCLFNSNATVNITFDDGTNNGNYSVALYNNNVLLQTFPYNSSYKYQYTWDKLEYGNYSITAIGSDDNGNSYIANYDPMKFQVYKYNTTVNINPIANVVYGENVIITFNIVNKTTVKYEVKDASGKIVKNGIVESDNLTLADLPCGNYIITITNNENENYSSSSQSASFTVNKAKVKLVPAKKTFKFKAAKKTKKVKVTLKDNKNKAVKKVKVTLKIKGKKVKGKKTFKAKTNKKGVVTFKITAKKTKFAQGKYKATLTFKGNANYQKASKKVKIVIK